MRKTGLYIGTSGWSYEHWIKNFYPEKLKAAERLHYYSAHFNTVEINTSFYHLPKVETVKNWDAQVSKDFLFSVKASRYITHMKRLKEGQETLPPFYERIHYLGKNCGPILLQLPPFFKANLERLEEFISHLDKKYRHVFEFRHPSWYTDATYQILEKAKLSLCVTDLDGTLSPEVVTTDFIYFRLHGPKVKYKGSYGAKKLKEWRNKLGHYEKQNMTTYCYFDNDEKGYAIQDAINLLKL